MGVNSSLLILENDMGWADGDSLSYHDKKALEVDACPTRHKTYEEYLAAALAALKALDTIELAYVYKNSWQCRFFHAWQYFPPSIFISDKNGKVYVPHLWLGLYPAAKAVAPSEIQAYIKGNWNVYEQLNQAADDTRAKMSATRTEIE